VTQKGYPEDGYILIEDAGVLQNGIAYICYAENYGQIKFLSFAFDDR